MSYLLWGAARNQNSIQSCCSPLKFVKMGNNASVDAKTKAEIRSIEEQIKRENIEAAERVKRENLEAAEKVRRDNELGIVRLTMVLSLAGIAALTLDYFAHGFRPINKMRVMWFLKHSRPPPINRIKLIPNDSERSQFISHVKTMTCPTVLIGPTGCGKSTLLLTALNEYFTEGRGNVVFISIRSSEHSHITNSNTSSQQHYNSDDDSHSFNNITKAILRSINFPLRPPLLFLIFKEYTFFGQVTDIRNILNDFNKKRLHEGLELLIECASQIGQSTGKPPLLVFDEIHDLIRVDRMKRIGGLSIFNLLANQATLFGVNFGYVRFLFASSSSELSLCFNETILHSNRRNDEYIGDFSRDVVVEFLFKEYGIPLEYTQRFTDRLGTRMRMISRLISAKDHLPPIDKFIVDHIKAVKITVAALMADPLVAPYFEAISNGGKVSLLDIPSNVLQMKQFSKAFYYSGHDVSFQNDAVATIWREEYQDSYRKSLAARQDDSK